MQLKSQRKWDLRIKIYSKNRFIQDFKKHQKFSCLRFKLEKVFFLGIFLSYFYRVWDLLFYNISNYFVYKWDFYHIALILQDLFYIQSIEAFFVPIIQIRGGQPAAQNEISVAQTRIQNERFFYILGVFLQFFGVLWPKKSIFLTYFPSCGPETILGWPPLILDPALRVLRY